MNGTKNKRRRGSMYVAVLGSTMVITVIGMSALMLARVERTSAEGTADLSAARFYAQSAIEMGQHKIHQDSNWRTTYTSGAWESNRTIGSGTYTLEGIDPVDGNLSNSASDSLLLRGTGFEGQSRYKLQVTMVSKSSALTCLQVAMHAGANLSFSSATVQSNQVTVSSNGSVTATTANVYPTVEAVTTISGTKYWSTQTPGITPRTMPDAMVYDFYTSNGTAITYSSIPSVSGKKTIEKCVLSPNSKPAYVASTNANGIYVINCALGDLRIRDCRIVGTLVILNPGVFTIENSILWEPAVINYPSLLVRGNATLNYTNTALSESSLKVNFNPASTPYQGGLPDTDINDSYPSVINGLVYASGAVATQSYATINGVMVVGTTLTAQNTLSLSYLSTYYDNPPPGFGGTPEMIVSPGTWQQLVD